MRPTVVAAVVLLAVGCSMARAAENVAAASFASARMPYGHLRLLGLSWPIEYFRASFGSGVYCGARRLLLAPEEERPAATPTPSRKPRRRRGQAKPTPTAVAAAPDDGASGGGGAAAAAAAAAVAAAAAEVGAVSGDAVAVATPAPTPTPLPEGANRLLCDNTTTIDGAEGAVLVAWRGVCSFADKAVNAMRLGAAGLVLVNDRAGLLRAPRGAVQAALAVDFPVVMVRNSTGPLLAQAFRTAMASSRHVHASLEPSEDMCLPGRADPEAGQAAIQVAPDAEALTAGKRGENSIVDAGLPKSMALTEMGMLRFRPAKYGGKLDAKRVPQSPVEFALAYFSGVAIPNMRAPVSFPDPFDGCTPFTDPDAVAGTVVVVDRGACPMINKARHAMDAGAVGVILVNGGASAPPPGTPQPVEDVDVSDVYGPLVGVTMAFGDEAPPLVTIPVVMVSREAAGDWRSNRDAFDNAVVTFTLSAARASSWERLLEVRDGGADAWPADIQGRLKFMEALLLEHHPRSRTGSVERMNFLSKLARIVGHSKEMRAVLDSLPDGALKPLPDIPELGLSGDANPKLLFNFAVSPFLSQLADPALLDVKDSSVLKCAMSQDKFIMSLLQFDPTATLTLDRKLHQLVAMQVCLERVAMHHAALLGKTVQLFQERLGNSTWKRLAPRLVGTLGVDESIAASMLEQFVPIGLAYNAAMTNLDSGEEGGPANVGEALQFKDV